MPEVSVKVNGENVKMHVERLFHSRNPVTKKHHVNFKEAGSKRGVCLHCRDEEEAEALVRGIREGEITDLTDYHAEFHSWN
ncbi:MAG: hypothetical protein K2P59_02360 [Acetatifactor sp.]|nr:hypothetical protein [Acetatifactor sp.]